MSKTTKPRYRSFWYHYNRNASRAAKAVRWTLHWQGKCLIVRDIDCGVHTSTRTRKTQPYAVVAGKAVHVQLKDEVAYVRN